MNARTEIASVMPEAARSRSVAWQPDGWASAELVAAVDGLAGYSLRQSDPTLEDLRLALQATGFTWSTKGELMFSRDRTALVTELNELIEAFGRDTSAADLFS